MCCSYRHCSIAILIFVLISLSFSIISPFFHNFPFFVWNVQLRYFSVLFHFVSCFIIAVFNDNLFVCFLTFLCLFSHIFDFCPFRVITFCFFFFIRLILFIVFSLLFNLFLWSFLVFLNAVSMFMNAPIFMFAFFFHDSFFSVATVFPFLFFQFFIVCLLNAKLFFPISGIHDLLSISWFNYDSLVCSLPF